MTAINGEPISAEAMRMVDYLRSRSTALDMKGIRERVRAAADELERVVAAVSSEEARLRPIPNQWTIAEVVDHIAQTQIRAAEELRHLFRGRRPPGPPVYEALRSGAAAWAPWPELVEGLRSANRELLDLLGSSPESEASDKARVRTILVVTRTLPDGKVGPQIFVEELNWREYAILQRLHLRDHRTQVKKIHAALSDAV